MAEAVLKNQDGTEKGKVTLPDSVFGVTPNKQAVYETIKGILRNQRQGTSSSKTRGEVRGTTTKPWRQKGTGRARSGSNKSPLWVGGGRIFGPRPRNYSVNVPKKTRRLALRSVLSDKAGRGEIAVIENYPAVDAPKTKLYSEFWNTVAPEGQKCLLVIEKFDENVFLSVRNLPRLYVTTNSNLNTYDAINVDRVIFTSEALKVFDDTES